MLCSPLQYTCPVYCTTRSVDLWRIWAFKISCYVPILLCRLKCSCYQSVPHWEAMSHLARGFFALLKLPKYSKSFLDAGSRAVHAEVFAVAVFFPICFQIVHNALLCSKSTDRKYSSPSALRTSDLCHGSRGNCSRWCSQKPH